MAGGVSTSLVRRMRTIYEGCIERKYCESVEGLLMSAKSKRDAALKELDRWELEALKSVPTGKALPVYEMD
jgi:hypothetical protein